MVVQKSTGQLNYADQSPVRASHLGKSSRIARRRVPSTAYTLRGLRVAET